GSVLKPDHEGVDGLLKVRLFRRQGVKKALVREPLLYHRQIVRLYRCELHLEPRFPMPTFRLLGYPIAVQRDLIPYREINSASRVGSSTSSSRHHSEINAGITKVPYDAKYIVIQLK